METTAKKNKEGIKHILAIPRGVEVSLEGNKCRVKGEKGTVEKSIAHPLLKLAKKEAAVEISSRVATKKGKRVINTCKAHLLNMFKGAKEGFSYKVKICSGHFPMTVKQEGNKIIITNFLGEKIPRTTAMLENVAVKIEKDVIFVEGADKESVGQTAANLERATGIKDRDRRVFQDGLYIVAKPGKKIK